MKKYSKLYYQVENELNILIERQEDLYNNLLDWYGSIKEVEEYQRQERKYLLYQYRNTLNDLEYDRLYDLYI